LNWRLIPELGGSLRVVADVGTHWLDMVTWLTGLQVTAVMADFATFIPVRHKPRVEVETFASKLSQSGDYDEVQVNPKIMQDCWLNLTTAPVALSPFHRSMPDGRIISFGKSMARKPLSGGIKKILMNYG
jgi:hypothetical protein